MNQREKEEYLREYSELKSQGKPFFPYIIVKDGFMIMLVVGTIMGLSLLLGAEQLPKFDATTTTYAPRPEWYYFWSFELFKVIKPPELVSVAAIGVPTVCVILLILLPFYDRSPERHPARRPVATTMGLFVIGALFYLSWMGAEAGPPSMIEIEAPARLVAQAKASPEGAKNMEMFQAGKELVAQSGCGGCHKIGENGNDGPGPPMTEIGDKLKADAIRQTLINPTSPMPSFKNLGPEKLNEMSVFLANLKASDEEDGQATEGAGGGGSRESGNGGSASGAR